MEADRRTQRRSHAQRSHDTQRRLVSSAIQLIEDRGYEAASIYEVAKTAGMTPGAVQHHFDSKASLMMRVLSELLEHAASSGDLWPACNLSLPARADAFVNNFWTLSYGKPRFLAAWGIYLGSRAQPDVLAHVADARQALGQTLTAQFLRVFPELACQPGHQAFVDLVFSSLRGLGMLTLFHADTPPAVRQQLDCLAALIVQRCQASA